MALPVACPDCGAAYNLKSQYAGRLLECPACHGVFRAPERQVPAVFDRDIFLLREKHFAIDTKYHVRDEDGNPLLYVERPALVVERFLTVAVLMAVALYLFFALYRTYHINWFLLALVVAYFVGPRRTIFFYPDENKTAAILTVTQDYFVQFPTTRYTLRDLAGNILAVYKKNRFTDFLRKRWWVYGPDGALLAVAHEDSIILSLFRRITGFIYDFAVFRTNFVIHAADRERVLGEFNRKMTIFDRYTLDLCEDAAGELDRRAALALGVLLDTGEGR
ncbi:hypothetical protein [Anaeroselena agilis]|uniref:DUF3137 domain-containing protein n=1 Tax=Anaeroselena agilis TaxID=3063788 RepID=A0ABU3P2H6_9FIRM|nr:hypothetical protein [Selenomonadales bacterium 4137-cl]